MNQKVSRQPPKPSRALPSNGARIGARPMISIIKDNIRAVSVWPKRSRTTARETTPPAQAPTAWTNRAAIRIPGDTASAQATEAATKIATPSRIGARLPRRSAAGP